MIRNRAQRQAEAAEREAVGDHPGAADLRARAAVILAPPEATA